MLFVRPFVSPVMTIPSFTPALPIQSIRYGRANLTERFNFKGQVELPDCEISDVQIQNSKKRKFAAKCGVWFISEFAIGA